MRIASKLYQIARLTNTIEAVLSGNPDRILRHIKNKIVGRVLARGGVFNKLYK